MYFDKERWNKYKTISLIDTDANGKRFRIPKEKTPPFLLTPENAINYCKSIAAQRDAASIRIARRREWENRRYDFKFLLDKYIQDRQKMAPNSWESDVSRTQLYVIPYFLNEAKSNSIVLWSDHYDDYRKWLAKVPPIKSKSGLVKKLSISSQNNCIKSLNNFLDFMMRKEKMEAVPMCKTYSRRLIQRKSAEDVMSQEVQKKIHAELLVIDQECADFFQFTNQTGLRNSEALGISMRDTIDIPPSGELGRMLNQYQLPAFGYILLDSQVKNAVKVRSADGTVERKPLKQRIKIDATEGRTIPIFSQQLFDLIKRRWLDQKEKLDRRTYGSNTKEYLLFENMNRPRYSLALRKACATAKVRRHVPHDSRHTFSTELVGKTGGNYLLAQTILGHRDQRETMGYTHIYKQIQIESQRRAQIERGFGCEFVMEQKSEKNQNTIRYQFSEMFN